jgi:hypothetical protein
MPPKSATSSGDLLEYLSYVGDQVAAHLHRYVTQYERESLEQGRDLLVRPEVRMLNAVAAKMAKLAADEPAVTP